MEADGAIRSGQEHHWRRRQLGSVCWQPFASDIPAERRQQAKAAQLGGLCDVCDGSGAPELLALGWRQSHPTADFAEPLKTRGMAAEERHVRTA